MARRVGRGLIVSAPTHFRSEGFGLLAVVCARVERRLRSSNAEDFDGLRGGGPKPKRRRARRVGAGDAQTAEADDAGAEEWGDVGVVEGRGNG